MSEDTKLEIIRISNWDFPYWDYAALTAGAAESGYVVGSNNAATRAITKLFVSKETCIICDADTLVRFNDARSVQETLLANVAYHFRTNIEVVYVQRPGAQDTHAYCYFEGIEPQEGRAPR